MYLLINETKLPIIEANTFWKRLKGLLGQKELKTGMLFKNCYSIHTCFMQTKIDVIILNSDNQIIAIYPNIPPFKFIFAKQKNTSILELPPNTSQFFHLEEQLFFHNSIF